MESWVKHLESGPPWRDVNGELLRGLALHRIVGYFNQPNLYSLVAGMPLWRYGKVGKARDFSYFNF